MGVYSNGIYGIDDATLDYHVSTARNRLQMYRDVYDKLQEIKEYSTTKMRLYKEDMQDHFEKYYVSDGEVRKSIINDFNEMTSNIDDLVVALSTLLTEIEKRKQFYLDLQSNATRARSSSPLGQVKDFSGWTYAAEILPGKNKSQQYKEDCKNTRFNIVGTGVTYYIED